MNENRLQLQKGDVIRLFRSQDSSDVWEITGEVGEGGSAICYEAVCGNKNGRLKEFYPWQSEKLIRMKRTASHQLVPVHAIKRKWFYGLCDAFAETYLKLERAKKADRDNEVLNNFIPPCEILYGADEDGVRGSVYIWTPDDKQGIGFDAYLAEIRRDPWTNGWKKLYEIVCILHTLTDCVRALHMAGFLHLDLKPSNFLLPFTSGKEINTGTVSLFDVNSLYDINDAIPLFAGSKGTRAPEVRRGRADNRSDIYSIGGMFYQAVIIDPTDDDPQGLFFDDIYDFIEHLTANSELICKSEIAGDRYVRYWVETILKKSLARNPEYRYGCCEELMKDLEGLRTFLEYTMARKALEAIGEENNKESRRAEPEDKKNVLYHTEIKVPFSPCLESYKMIELAQKCSIGIDIGYDAVQVAAGNEKDWRMISLEGVDTEAFEIGRVKEDAGLFSAFFHDVFMRIRESRLYEWGGNAEKIAAVLSLPIDVDAEEIDVICRIAAAYGIYIRRVVCRTDALAVAAWKIAREIDAEEKRLKKDIIACLADGNTLLVSVVQVRNDFDLNTRKAVVMLKGREIGFARDIAAEHWLDVIQDSAYMLCCRPAETIVALKAGGKGNEKIIKQAAEKGFFLRSEYHALQPCYGTMLLNDMMRMLQPETLQLDAAPPFDIHFQIDGQRRLPIVRKGLGLLPQYGEISFDLPPSEKSTDIRIFRTTFGCQEKMIASVAIPGNRYLRRKVYIYTDIQQNHDMIFKIEVIEGV